MITFIQFVSEVPIGGDWPAISYWSADKHAKQIHVEERGSWVVLSLGRVGDNGEFLPNGKRRRVPITNVVSISEEGEAEKPSKRKDGV